MADEQTPQQVTREQQFAGGKTSVREDGAIWLDYGQKDPITGKSGGWYYNMNGAPTKAPDFIAQGSIPWEALSPDEREKQKFTMQGARDAVRNAVDINKKYKDTLFSDQTVNDYLTWNSGDYFKNLLTQAMRGDKDALSKYQKYVNGEMQVWKSKKDKEKADFLANQFEPTDVEKYGTPGIMAGSSYIPGPVVAKVNKLGEAVMGSEGILPNAFLSATVKPVLDLHAYFQRMGDENRPKATGDQWGADRVSQMAYDKQQNQGTLRQAMEAQQEKMDPSSLYEGTGAKLLSQGPSQLLAMIPQMAVGAAAGLPAASLGESLGFTGKGLQVFAGLGAALPEAVTEAATAGNTALDNAAKQGMSEADRGSLAKRAFWGTLGANMALLGTTNNFGAMGDMVRDLAKRGEKEGVEEFAKVMAKDLLKRTEFKEAAKQGLKLFAKEGAEAFVSEGLEEGLQGTIQRVLSEPGKITTKRIYDESLGSKEFWQDMLMGGALGAVAGGASTGLSVREAARTGLPIEAVAEGAREGTVEKLGTPEARGQFTNAINDEMARIQQEGGTPNPAGVEYAKGVLSAAQMQAMGPYADRFSKYMEEQGEAKISKDDIKNAISEIGLKADNEIDQAARDMVNTAAGVGGSRLAQFDSVLTAIKTNQFKSPEVKMRAEEILSGARAKANERHQEASWNNFVRTLSPEEQADLRDTVTAMETTAAPKELADQTKPMVEAAQTETAKPEAAPAFDEKLLAQKQVEIQKRLQEAPPATPAKMKAEMLGAILSMKDEHGEPVLTKDGKAPSTKSLNAIIDTLTQHSNDPVEAALELKATHPQVIAELGPKAVSEALAQAAAYRTTLANRAERNRIAPIRTEYDTTHGKGFFEAAQAYKPKPAEPKEAKLKKEKAPKVEKKAEARVEEPAKPAAREESAEGQAPPAKAVEKPEKPIKAKKEQAPKKEAKPKRGIEQAVAAPSEGTEATGNRPPQAAEEAPAPGKKPISKTKAGKERGIMSPQRFLEEAENRAEEMAQAKAAETEAPQAKGLVEQEATAKPEKKEGVVAKSVPTKSPAPAAWHASTGARRSKAEITTIFKTAANRAITVQNLVSARERGEIAIGVVPDTSWSYETMKKELASQLPPGSKNISREEMREINQAMLKAGFIEPSPIKRGQTQSYRIVGTKTAAEVRAEAAQTSAQRGQGIGSPVLETGKPGTVADQLRPKTYREYLELFPEKDRAAIELMFQIGSGTAATSSLSRVVNALQAAGYNARKSTLQDLSNRVLQTLSHLYPVTAPTAPDYLDRMLGTIKQVAEGRIHVAGDVATGVQDAIDLLTSNEFRGLQSLSNVAQGNWAKEIALISQAPGWHDFVRKSPVFEDGHFKEQSETLMSQGFKSAFQREINTRMAALQDEFSRENDFAKKVGIQNEMDMLKAAVRIVNHIGSTSENYVAKDELTWAKAVKDRFNKEATPEEMFNTWIGSGVAFDTEGKEEAVSKMKIERQAIVDDAYRQLSEYSGQSVDALKQNTLPELQAAYTEQLNSNDPRVREGGRDGLKIVNAAMEKVTLPFETGMTAQDRSGLMVGRLMLDPETRWVPGGVDQSMFHEIHQMDFNQAVTEAMALGNVLKGKGMESYREIMAEAERQREAGINTDALERMYATTFAEEVSQILNNKGPQVLQDTRDMVRGLTDKEAMKIVRSRIMEGTSRASRSTEDMTLRAWAWLAMQDGRGGSDPYGWVMQKMSGVKKGKQYVKSEAHKEEERALRLHQNITTTSNAIAGTAGAAKLTKAKARVLEAAQKASAGVVEALREAKLEHDGDNRTQSESTNVPYAATWSMREQLDKLGITHDITPSNLTTDKSALVAFHEIETALKLSGKYKDDISRIAKAESIFRDALDEHAKARDEENFEDRKAGKITEEALNEEYKRQQEREEAWVENVREARREKVANAVFTSKVMQDMVSWVSKDSAGAIGALAEALGTTPEDLKGLSAKANEYAQLVLGAKEMLAKIEAGKKLTKKEAQILKEKDANAFIGNTLQLLKDEVTNHATNVLAGMSMDESTDRLKRAAEALQAGRSTEAGTGALALGIAPLGVMGMADGSFGHGVALTAAVVGLELGARYVASRMGLDIKSGLAINAVGEELFNRAKGKLQVAATMIRQWFAEIGHKIGLGSAVTLAKYTSPELTGKVEVPVMSAEAYKTIRSLQKAGHITEKDMRSPAPAMPSKINGPDGRGTTESIRAVVDRIEHYVQNPGRLIHDYVMDPRSFEGRYISGDLSRAVVGGMLGSDFWLGMVDNQTQDKLRQLDNKLYAALDSYRATVAAQNPNAPTNLYYVYGANASGKTRTIKALLGENKSVFAEERMMNDMLSKGDSSMSEMMRDTNGAFGAYKRFTLKEWADRNLSRKTVFVFNDNLDNHIKGFLLRGLSEGRVANGPLFSANVLNPALVAAVMARKSMDEGYDFWVTNSNDKTGDFKYGQDAVKAIDEYLGKIGWQDGMSKDKALVGLTTKYDTIADAFFAARPDVNPLVRVAATKGTSSVEFLNEYARVRKATRSGPSGPQGGGPQRGGERGPSQSGAVDTRRSGGEAGGAPASPTGQRVGTRLSDEGTDKIEFLSGGIGGTEEIIKGAADMVQNLFSGLKTGPNIPGARGSAIQFEGKTPGPVEGKIGFSTTNTPGLKQVQEFVRKQFRQTAVSALMAGGPAQKVMQTVTDLQDTKGQAYGEVEPVLKALKDRASMPDATPESMGRLGTAVMLSSVKKDALPTRMLQELGLGKEDIAVYNQIKDYVSKVKDAKLSAIDMLEARMARDMSEQATNAQTEEEYDRIGKEMQSISSELDKSREIIKQSNFYLPLYRNPDGEYVLTLQDTKAKGEEDDRVGVMLLSKEQAKSPEAVRQAASLMLDQYAQKLWAESNGSKPLTYFRDQVRADMQAGRFEVVPPKESIAKDENFRKHANAVKGVFDEQVLASITRRLSTQEGPSRVTPEAYKAMASALSYTLMAAPLSDLRATRQNIPGWSNDLGDVMRRYAWAEGSARAHMTAVPELRSALGELYEAAESSKSSIGKETFDYINDYVHGSLSNRTGGKNKVSRFLTSALFYKTMGLKPITGVINGLTQGWLTSKPMMDTVYRNYAGRDEVYKQAQRAARSIVINEMAGLGDSISQLDDAKLREVMDKYITPERFGTLYADKNAMPERLNAIKDAVSNWVRSGMRETNTADLTSLEEGSKTGLLGDTSKQKVKQVLTYSMEKSEVSNRLRDVLWSAAMATSDKPGTGILRVQDHVGGNRAMLIPYSKLVEEAGKAVKDEMPDLPIAQRVQEIQTRVNREITRWAETSNAINNFSNATGYGSRTTWGDASSITRPLWLLRGFGTNVMFHMGAMHDLHQMLDRAEGKKSSWGTLNKGYIRGITTAMLMGGLFGMTDDLADVANMIANLFASFWPGKTATVDVRREVFEAMKGLGDNLEKNITGKTTGTWGGKVEDFARGGITRPFGADLGGMMNISNAIDISRGKNPIERMARAVLGPWSSLIDSGVNFFDKPGVLDKVKAVAPAGLVGPLDAVFSPEISPSAAAAGKLNPAERGLRVLGVNPTSRARAFDAMDREFYIRNVENEIQKYAREDFKNTGHLSQSTMDMIDNLRRYEAEYQQRLTRMPKYGTYLKGQTKRARSIMENEQ